MEAKVNYTVVGLFVLALGAAFFGVFFWLYGGGAQHRHYDKYLTYFDESVSGLSLNSTVRYRGVEVGRVIDIELAPDQSGRVRVQMKIDRTTPIKDDTLATLKMQGLTGLSFVELSGGTPTAKALVKKAGEDYPVIKTKFSMLKKLDVSVTNLIENMAQTSENLNELTNAEMRQSMQRMLANLESVTQLLAEQKPALERVLKNAEHTLAATSKSAEEIGKLAKRLNQTAQMVEGMAGDIGQASRSVHGTLNDARQPLRDLSGQTLPELNALAAEMRELASTMKRVGNDLEQNPEMLVFGRGAPQPGPGE